MESRPNEGEIRMPIKTGVDLSDIENKQPPIRMPIKAGEPVPGKEEPPEPLLDAEDEEEVGEPVPDTEKGKR